MQITVTSKQYKNAVEQIKLLRVDIDNTMQEFQHVYPRPYVTKSYESLMFGRAWLGLALAALGSDTPYKNDGNRKEVKDIEPATDKEVNPSQILKHMNFVQQLDTLRQTIQAQYNRIPKSHWTDQFLHRDLKNALQEASNNMTEARIWLGYELGTQRELENKRSWINT